MVQKLSWVSFRDLMHVCFGRPEVYIFCNGKNFAILVCYVDVIVLYFKNEKTIQTVVSRFKDNFGIRIKHKIRRFLCLLVDNGIQLRLHNKSMIDHLLNFLKMVKWKVVTIPLPMWFDLCTVKGGNLENKTPYRQLIKSLQHLANTVRPDISYALGYLSCFFTNK